MSSPNTPGLRSLQAADALEALVDGVQEELGALGLRVPLLVKIAPDLTDAEIDAVADLAVRRGLDGLIAINTTTDRGPLVSTLRAPGEPGGISGAPIAARSLEILRRLRARVGDELVLVSVGGVGDGEDAWERLAGRRDARAGLHRLRLRRPAAGRGAPIACWPAAVARAV